MQSELYRLEGELRVTAEARDNYKQRSEANTKDVQTTNARLQETMREFIRLTAENEALRAMRGRDGNAPDLKQIAASCDTQPKAGDASSAAPLVSGAVPSEETADAQPPSPSNGIVGGRG